MINTSVKLSPEIEQRLNQLSDEVHIILDFSNDGYKKVIVKAKYNGSYNVTQGSPEYSVTINDFIDDCIVNLQELLEISAWCQVLY